MLNNLPSVWRDFLNTPLEIPNLDHLWAFLEMEFQEKQILPMKTQIFRAFELTLPTSVQAIIIGQDPYPTPGHANGLSFSVNDGVKLPASLVNIYKAIAHDYPDQFYTNGNLDHWAKQGVLLLNSVLTVRANEAGSHQGKGWETFTDHVIRTLSLKRESTVFLLWGNAAFEKEKLIDTNKHLVLKAVHPSPLSAYRGFITCGHFKKTNEHLELLGKKSIIWHINW